MIAPATAPGLPLTTPAPCEPFCASADALADAEPFCSLKTAAFLFLDHAGVCFGAARNHDVIVDQHGRINRSGKQVADLIVTRIHFIRQPHRDYMAPGASQPEPLARCCSNYIMLVRFVVPVARVAEWQTLRT